MNYKNQIEVALSQIKNATVAGGLESFTTLALLAFNQAVDIVHQRDRHTVESFVSAQILLSECLKAWKAIGLKDELYFRHWPQLPVAFGNFQVVKSSALETAISFAEYIQNALQVAKLQVGGGFVVEDWKPAQFKKWIKATKQELEGHTLDLSDWTAGKMLRDKAMITLLVEFEFTKVSGLTNREMIRAIELNLGGRNNTDIAKCICSEFRGCDFDRMSKGNQRSTSATIAKRYKNYAKNHDIKLRESPGGRPTKNYNT